MGERKLDIEPSERLAVVLSLDKEDYLTNLLSVHDNLMLVESIFLLDSFATYQFISKFFSGKATIKRYYYFQYRYRYELEIQEITFEKGMILDDIL